ncbi:hypothetical protein PAAG_03744 [Paracoccidioides lutzii Pb01]|uniref:Uncharacterized protein n=1 Tax=Paracoccidioides lutzii (strain ATCC MYA-826 / Pb01) TaxID=502779 RepID=C1GZ00_PARBA|nr:hypothetical protein PAAG_03744 [Paracoccidioides lutzii Pb01]EEH41823.1 hypothetical protein PAAG_03744 [Paracoccidioides lutzii Pb01]
MTLPDSPMPGTFILDSPIPPKLDLVGARSQFYRSPHTPSAASSLHRSARSDHGSRKKRARYGYGYVADGDAAGFLEEHSSLSPSKTAASTTLNTTSITATTWRDQSMTTTSLSRIASPTPLVNTAYRFAGGVDTSSTLPFEKQGYYDDGDDDDDDDDDDANGPEVDYRPNRYQDLVHMPMDTPSLAGSPVCGGRAVSTARKRSRRESMLSSQRDGMRVGGSSEGGGDGGRGWGSAVIKIVGGVAVKVWDLCWPGPFRGFYAGGGKGYEMPSEQLPPLSSQASTMPRLVDAGSRQNVCEKDGDFSSGDKRTDGPINVPGQFPAASITNSQRYLHSVNHDELQGNWVLVRKGKSAREEEALSPSSSSYTSARNMPPESNSIYHHPVSTPRRIAVGRLARRQTLIPMASRPSSSYSSSHHLYSNTNDTNNNNNNLTHRHHHHHHFSRKNASSSPFEPNRSRGPTKQGSSPVSLEAQRYAAKAKRREREEDASIRRLNQQLKAMIKEGREALGTTIEIEDDGMDVDEWD